MKINVYYDNDGISILDVLSEDFLCFLQLYLEQLSKKGERRS